MKTRTLIWILAIWLASIAVMMLVSGCKTIRKVERVEIHDTLISIKRDTAHVYHVSNNTDTIRLTERIEVTKNVQGDTVKLITYCDRWRDRMKIDTLIVYRERTDTAATSKHDTSHTEITKKAKDPVLFICVALIVLGVCSYYIYRK